MNASLRIGSVTRSVRPSHLFAAWENPPARESQSKITVVRVMSRSGLGEQMNGMSQLNPSRHVRPSLAHSLPLSSLCSGDYRIEQPEELLERSPAPFFLFFARTHSLYIAVSNGGCCIQLKVLLVSASLLYVNAANSAPRNLFINNIN